MSADKKKMAKRKKPVSYFYNPFYKSQTELQFLEVWQVLEDDVLGSLYPWQYVATAENSNRIVTLNFLALKNFENDYRKFYDQIFVYRVSAKLLSEGNVHRLGSIIQPNLILCFDIYQLERFGDKAALAGLNFLTNIGATIMISGVDKAPVDVLLKYPASYYLLDYRYYTNQNKGLISMMKQIAAPNNITLVVSNVNNKDNLKIFEANGIEIFAGSAIVRPKRKVESFVEQTSESFVEDQEKSYVVQAKNAPKMKNKEKVIDPQEEIITLNVTSQKDEIKAKLAKAALKKQKEKQNLEEDTKKKNKKEAKSSAKKLDASVLTTSMEEFASLPRSTTKKEIKRGANVIKLKVSTPPKKKK